MATKISSTTHGTEAINDTDPLLVAEDIIKIY